MTLFNHCLHINCNDVPNHCSSTVNITWKAEKKTSYRLNIVIILLHLYQGNFQECISCLDSLCLIRGTHELSRLVLKIIFLCWTFYHCCCCCWSALSPYTWTCRRDAEGDKTRACMFSKTTNINGTMLIEINQKLGKVSSSYYLLFQRLHCL